MRNETTTEEVTDLLQNLFIDDNFAKLLSAENQSLFYNYTQNSDCGDGRVQVKYTLKQLELLIFTDMIIESVLANLNPKSDCGQMGPSISSSTSVYSDVEKCQILNKLIEAKKVFSTNHFELINSFYGMSIIEGSYLNNNLAMAAKIINDFDNVYNPNKLENFTYNETEIDNICLPCGEMEFLNLVSFFKSLRLPDLDTSIKQVYFTKNDLLESVLNHFSFEYYHSSIYGFFYKNSHEFFVNDFKELVEKMYTNNKNYTYFMAIEIGEIEDKEKVLDFISSLYYSQLKMYNFKITIKMASDSDNKRIAVQTIVL